MAKPDRKPMFPAAWTAPGAARIHVGDLKATNWRRPAFRALAVHAATFAILAGVAAVGPLSASMAAFLAAAVVAALALAFAYRGLENLVHGASHYDLLGPARATANDRLGDILAAFAVFQSVAAFRPAHLREHHAKFGGETDPCRARHQNHPDVAKGQLPTLWETAKRAPAETVAFYRLIGARPSILLYGAAWHAIVLLTPLWALLGDLGAAASAWGLVMALLFTVTLPMVRVLAETGEHDYRPGADEAASVVEATFNHEGTLNALLHPFGDKYHIEHHLYPTVPQYNLASVHERLIAAGLGSEMKRRDGVLSAPKPYTVRSNRRAELRAKAGAKMRGKSCDKTRTPPQAAPRSRRSYASASPTLFP